MSSRHPLCICWLLVRLLQSHGLKQLRHESHVRSAHLPYTEGRTRLATPTVRGTVRVDLVL